MLWPSNAEAVEVTVCVAVTNSPKLLWDYSPTMDGRDLREDFGRLDQTLPMPYMLTSVLLGPNRIWGWAPLDENGCTKSFDAPVGAQLQVEVHYWSYNPDTNVSVVSLECPGEFDCTSGSTPLGAHVPEVGGTISLLLPGSRQDYVHYAAATAESRVPTASNVTYYTRSGIDLRTTSNRFAGGRPTSSLGGDAFRRKFTVAHEFGHLKTLVAGVPAFSNADVDYCYGAPSDCTLTWSRGSAEYQSAAAVEGFADFFAMLVWNDPDAPLRDGVLGWADSHESWRCRYNPDPGHPQASILPDQCDSLSNQSTVADSWHYQGHCDPVSCPAGVATASDWTFALWDMRVETFVPVNYLLGLLALSYPWPINGEDSDFWDEFIDDIAGPGLSGDELVAWLEFAHRRGIDR